MYYFVEWIQTDDGVIPALLEGMGCLFLAEPSKYGTYAISIVDVPSDEASQYSIQAVPDDLADLIEAAEHSPPALAIARDRTVSGGDRTAFGEALASCLREILSSQPESPFFLASAKRTQAGYKVREPSTGSSAADRIRSAAKYPRGRATTSFTRTAWRTLIVTRLSSPIGFLRAR